MKRKLLAVTLAATMIAGMSMTAMAETAHDGDHGTDSTAVVGDGPEGNTTTQFYITVDKDATKETVELPKEYTVDGDGDTICHYIIDTKIERNATLKVTVPLYVCMYGYGGNGKVVTPSEDKYQMTNNSTYSEKESYVSITPCYKVIRLVKTDEQTIGTKEQKIPTDVMTQIDEEGTREKYFSGNWGYYKVKNGENSYKYQLVKIANCGDETQDVSTAGINCKEGYYYIGTPISSESDDFNTYKTAAKLNDNDLTKIENQSLIVNIPTVTANNANWEIRPLSESASLKAGQIAMSIKGYDLYNLQQDSDITDQKWSIAGGSTLPLPVTAVIAGGNVNDDGCVPVVSVTYTISPDFESSEIANTPVYDESQ